MCVCVCVCMCVSALLSLLSYPPLLAIARAVRMSRRGDERGKQTTSWHPVQKERMRQTWLRFGCSIVMDGWTDI